MLRSLLMGVLALSTASACKGGGDAPAVQPGIAVGKVVEASGDVSATRGTAKRALASGQEISGDDVIETGAQANVRILFAHNNATWELGPNKKQLVSESLAWKAPKSDKPAGEVNEATLAAGRHAERETVTTGTTAPEPRAAVPAAQPLAAPAEPTGGSPAPVVSDKREEEKAKPSRRDVGAAPGANKKSGGGIKERASFDLDDGVVERRPAKTSEAEKLETNRRPPAPINAPIDPHDSPPPPPPPPDELAKKKATDDVRGAVNKQRTELAKCMGTATLSLDVIVANGKARFVFPAGTSDKAKSCFSAIAAKLSFPAHYNVTTTIVLAE